MRDLLMANDLESVCESVSGFQPTTLVKHLPVYRVEASPRMLLVIGKLCKYRILVTGGSSSPIY